MHESTTNAATSRIRLFLVLACFFLSGVAGLLYETVWTRQFVFVFGSSDLAVATVLAAYFGGLTAGAAIAARWAARVRRPILVYGLLEAGIALAALAVSSAIGMATKLYAALFATSDVLPASGGLSTALFYLLCSFVILLVPTALMGATLPLLARHAVHSDRELGPRVGMLYSVNAAGAVVGTLCAAFVLLPRMGLGQTIHVGVAINALVFVGAVLLARGSTPAKVEPCDASAPRRSGDGHAWILPLILMSGAVAFCYEVLWTRLLSHVLGGSVYAFATMLAAFLTGIAAGSAIGSRLSTDIRRAACWFGWTQLGTAGLSLAAFAAVDQLPHLAERIGAGGGALGANAFVAALVLLPGALCIGATYPLAVRTLARRTADAGPASARVYAWNTIGAIVGSVGTGYFILPALGYAGTVIMAVVINLALAVAIIVLVRPVPRPLAVASAAGLIMLVLVRPGEPWNVLRFSPLLRSHASGEVVHYAVGRGATVLVTDAGSGWESRSNGLPEAFIRRPGVRPGNDMLSAWLGRLPVLARPEAKRMMVVGLGGGAAIESLPSTLETIDVVELEPEVVRANRRIAAERADNPLSDPRVNLIINDARNAMLLGRARYDAIVSQPSHPWTAGASHLYTREFFELVHAHLAPAGVFVQWLGPVFADEVVLRSLLATLSDVFGHVMVFRPTGGRVLFLASDAPFDLPASFRRALEADAQNYARFGLFTAEDVAARLVLDERGVRSLGAGAPLITDDFNLLQLRSPRMMRAALSFDNVLQLFAQHDPLLTAGPALDRVRLVQALLLQNDVQRATRIAQAAPQRVDQQIGAGLVLSATGNSAMAEQAFRAALAEEPGSVAARFHLLSMQRMKLVNRDPETRRLALPTTDPERAVLEGWVLAFEQNWQTLSEHEPRLAAAVPTDPSFFDARHQRVQWRIRSGDPRLAGEAIDLLDSLLARRVTFGDLMLRTEAATIAGKPLTALITLEELVSSVPAVPQAPEMMRQIQAALDRVPPDASTAEMRERVRRKLDGEDVVVGGP